MKRQPVSLLVLIISGLVLQLSAATLLAQQPESEKVSPTVSIIPFKLTKHNNIVIQAKINQQEIVNLMFHLAVPQVSLTSEASKKLKSVKWTDSHTVKSWGGESKSFLSRKNKLKIGDFVWDNLIISQSTHSGKETDGKFGPDLFKDKSIQIDFLKRQLIIHSSELKVPAGFKKMPIHNQNGMMFVEGQCEFESQKVKELFLLHTGYGGGLLLNDQFVAKHRLTEQIKIIETQELKDSYGNVIKVQKGTLPGFMLGNLNVKDVPVGFFEGKVGRQKISVLGSGLLKRFNIVISRDRKFLFIKPAATS